MANPDYANEAIRQYREGYGPLTNPNVDYFGTYRTRQPSHLWTGEIANATINRLGEAAKGLQPVRNGAGRSCKIPGRLAGDRISGAGRLFWVWEQLAEGKSNRWLQLRHRHGRPGCAAVTRNR